VALTRPTQRLVLVHRRALSAGFEDLVDQQPSHRR
jgi:hypothetical protein